MDINKCFKLLDIDRTDDKEIIKKAFKKQARLYHPDKNKNPGAEDKFKEINEAYQTITKPRNAMRQINSSNVMSHHDIIRHLFKTQNMSVNLNSSNMRMYNNSQSVNREIKVEIIGNRRIETINETINGVTITRRNITIFN
jgi:hypothetical protein